MRYYIKNDFNFMLVNLTKIGGEVLSRIIDLAPNPLVLVLKERDSRNWSALSCPSASRPR